ncbi:EAL domain-containing protein [Allohahella marinimesophila]|uniref:EAL domain-containing protein n=1 Tax=Allohahella marinimesophila TaxID=1054972 RepID=UPI003CD097B9
MYLQPQMDLKSDHRLLGVEALLCWRHPRLGLISPMRFIPVAEDSREIMVALGKTFLAHLNASGRLAIWSHESR